MWSDRSGMRSDRWQANTGTSLCSRPEPDRKQDLDMARTGRYASAP